MIPKVKIDSVSDSILVEIFNNYPHLRNRIPVTVNDFLVNIRNLIEAQQKSKISNSVMLRCLKNKYKHRFVEVNRDIDMEISITPIIYKYGISINDVTRRGSKCSLENIYEKLSIIENPLDLNIAKKMLPITQSDNAIDKLTTEELLRYFELQEYYEMNCNLYKFISFESFLVFCFINVLNQGVKIAKCVSCGKFFVSTNNRITCSDICQDKRKEITATNRKEDPLYNLALKTNKKYDNHIRRFKYEKWDNKNFSCKASMDIMLKYYQHIMKKANNIILRDTLNDTDRNAFCNRYMHWLCKISNISENAIIKFIENNKLDIVLFDFKKLNGDFETESFKTDSPIELYEYLVDKHKIKIKGYKRSDLKNINLIS